MAKRKSKITSKKARSALQKPVAPKVSRGENPSGLVIAAFVISILGFIFSWVPFAGWLLNLIAVVFASTALKQGHPGKGFALIALILGIIGLAIWVLIIIFVAYFTIPMMRMFGL